MTRSRKYYVTSQEMNLILSTLLMIFMLFVSSGAAEETTLKIGFIGECARMSELNTCI